MLKGVNKTVIEINCTDHGYFERAILFINPEQSHTSQKRLYADAEKYIDLISLGIKNTDLHSIHERKSVFKDKKVRMLILLSVTLFAAVGGLFLVLNIL